MMLTYTGPHSGVEVLTPGGRRVVVARGGRADFPEAVAEDLLAQGEDHWQRAKAAHTETKAVAAPENKADAKEVN